MHEYDDRGLYLKTETGVFDSLENSLELKRIRAEKEIKHPRFSITELKNIKNQLSTMLNQKMASQVVQFSKNTNEELLSHF
jgi:hypothetical protein